MKLEYQTMELKRDDIKRHPNSIDQGGTITTSCSVAITSEQYYLPFVELIELMLKK